MKLCLADCPPGMYFISAARECVPCASGCVSGCGGPLPYIDPNGCQNCNLVELDRSDNQVCT